MMTHNSNGSKEWLAYSAGGQSSLVSSQASSVTFSRSVSLSSRLVSPVSSSRYSATRRRLLLKTGKRQIEMNADCRKKDVQTHPHTQHRCCSRPDALRYGRSRKIVKF